MRSARGQSTVEWTALVLLVAIVLGGVAHATGTIDAGWLPGKIRCAVMGGCQGGDPELVAAYGADTAALVRTHAPIINYEPRTLTLPVDFRTCREHACSDGPDRRGHEVHRSAAGQQATAFTRVVDRRAQGGPLYVQYWLYYPDSNFNGKLRVVTRGVRDAGGVAGVGQAAGRASRDIPPEGTGYHLDDWESHQLRIWPDGRIEARASAHHGYTGRRDWPNDNEAPDGGFRDVARGIRSATGRRPVDPRAWIPVTGYTRVSRGSHAGHIPDGWADGERRTEVDGLRLVPLETLDASARATRFEVVPPWEKPVYADPERIDT